MRKWMDYISGIFLAALLLLLTIGLPLTYSSISKLKQQTAASNKYADKNPYSSSTEEKTASNNLTVNEEYVHAASELNPLVREISVAYIHAHEATYRAYHGELHCPPPNC
ncbi:hypothetical protein GCM10027051_09020 [Niabella terrae]